MRRLLVLCLLFMLPLQGAWAVRAEIHALDAPCAAAQLAALHDAQDGSRAPHGAGTMPDCLGEAPFEPCCDGSCGDGHVNVPVLLLGLPVVPGDVCSGSEPVAICASGAPDHIPDQALRPPL